MSMSAKYVRGRFRLPQLAFIAGMVPVLLVWFSLRHQNAEEGRRQFDMHVREIVDAIGKRMRQHEQILLGGAGIFDASIHVSRAEWHTYVERLRLPENYPGIQGVGFSQVIAPRKLAVHISEIRAEGFPDYTVRPPGDRERYTSIVYLEPFSGRNLSAFGYDMFSEETRRAAMIRAAETGKTAISGKVKLVQETHGKPQAGFLMYVPVYFPGRDLSSPELRWSALRGFVYSPYRVDDLMRGIVGERSLGIDLTIYDGLRVSPENLIHSAGVLHKARGAASSPKFAIQTRIDAYGHSWTLVLESRQEFEAQLESGFEWLVLAMGFGASLLLSALTGSLAHRRERAQALAEEMTARSRANEEALHESLGHIRAIIDNVIDGIITIDARGTIVSFNKAAEQIFGYLAEDVVGRNVSLLMPEPHRSAHDGYLANFHATGEARIIGIGREVEGLRRNGDTFSMELSVSATSRGGEPLYIGLVRDITERKRVERMKNEFVATVSHELRTPLTSIAGSLGLLASGTLGEFPAAARPLLDIAYKNSQRLADLINDLLDMEKITAGKMRFNFQCVQVKSIVTQALEANQAYAQQRRVSFSLIERDVGLEARVDVLRFVQVLANYLSNAAKFSPEGGTVEVEISRHADQVQVSVRDHGPGIPVKFHKHIFQKFSQADSSDTRQQGGTGLGLAISKELVEHMGGAVGFTSVPGEGATFYCRFPLAQHEHAD